MHARSLIKTQTLVALVVFTLGFSLRAGAQIGNAPIMQNASEVKWLENCSPVPSGKYNDASCNVLKQAAYPSATGGTCDTQMSDYKKAFAKIQRISSDKVEYYRNCLAGEASEGRNAMYGEGSNTEDDKCATVAKAGCAELVEVGRKDLFKEAQEDATKARQAVIDLEQQVKTQQKTLKRKMAALQLKQEVDVKTYQLQLDAIQKEFEATVKSQDQELRKKMAEFRKLMTAKSSELNAINDSVRAAENAVAVSKFSWEAACRNEAFTKLENVKQEIAKKKDEQLKLKSKINYAGNALAGAKNRREARERMKQQSEYVNSYKTCVAGASGVGASERMKSETAAKTLESTKTSAAERRAIVETDIKNLMADFAADELATAENKDTIKKQTESKVAAANVAYEAGVKQAAQAAVEMQEDLADSIDLAQKSSQLALENANTAQMALATAKLREECGGGAASSSTESTRLHERYQSIVDADESRSALCGFTTTDKDGDATSCPNVASICKQGDEIRAKLSEGGGTNR